MIKKPSFLNYEAEVKIAFFLLLLFFIGLNFTTIFLLQQITKGLKQEVSFRLSTIGGLAGKILDAEEKNPSVLEEKIKSLAVSAGANLIFVIDRQNRVMAKSALFFEKQKMEEMIKLTKGGWNGEDFISPFYLGPQDRFYLFYCSPYYEGDAVTHLIFIETASQFAGVLTRSVKIGIFIWWFGFSAAVIWTLFFIRSILKPYRQISKTAREYEEKTERQGEVEFVVETYQKAIEELKENKRILEKLYAQSQEKASSLERYNEHILTSIQSGVINFNERGEITFFNKAAEEILGEAKEELAQKTFSRIVEAGLKEGKTFSREEMRFQRSDHDERWLGLSSSLLRDKEGKEIGVTILLTDLTEVKRLEEEISLREKMSALGEIAYHLAEKMTPLITTLKEEVKRTDLQEKISELQNSFKDIVQYAKFEPKIPKERERALVGNSEKWQEVLTLVKKVAKSESTVILYGESGTGKELVAREIHLLSPRFEGPFVSINCGALPETLLESELFGHIKGSFTGAIRDKDGLLKVAEGGTFFLDEISETSPAIQVKLLRVLQEREIVPVGGTKPIKVNVRIISATNADLPQLIKQGKFREDLFYRINVFQIYLPPLRDRKQDIPLLAEYFLQLYSQKTQTGKINLSKEALDRLTAYSWPGNVRELENTLERAVVLSEGKTIQPEHLWLPGESSIAILPLGEGKGLLEMANETAREAEKKMIRQVLKETKGNKSQAAKILKISYRVMLKKIKEYGI
ncbi:MAG: sigma 54-interacting transcriptional regulator [Candidatus Edwardsbacteria bacterium]